MAMSIISRIATCALICGGAFGFSQSPTDGKTPPHIVLTPDCKQAADQGDLVRAHMLQIQAQFDQMNDSVWQRVAFVALLSDIRPLRPGDKIVGGTPLGKAEVAVLYVKALGGQKDIGFKGSSVIVCPVGKSRALWEHWLHQKTEMVFEYNRIGDKEFVLKFGC